MRNCTECKFIFDIDRSAYKDDYLTNNFQQIQINIKIKTGRDNM